MACYNATMVALKCEKLYSDDSVQMEECYLKDCFVRKTSISSHLLIPITVLYGIIFVLGVAGNLTTCIVIRKHHLLQKMSTNKYLFNLALADLVTLLVGMPFEIYLLWNQYPWILPDVFCHLKALISEATSYVSVLTILTFSIERYVAICHSFSLPKLATVHRKLKYILLLIWTLAASSAFPYALYHWADYFIKKWPGDPNYGPIKMSKMCMVAFAFDQSYYSTFQILFHLSAIFYFLLPLIIIVFLYTRIAIKVTRSQHALHSLTQGAANVSHDFHSKKVLLMLIAVIGAFFVCYAPYQLQRLVFFWADSRTVAQVNKYLYIPSGVLFYLAQTLNPLLYNLMSKRYRSAFRQVLTCSDKPENYAYTKTRMVTDQRTVKNSLENEN